MKLVLKILVKLLLYVIVPIVIIVLLFLRGTLFGFLGILAYLVILILKNLSGLYKLMGGIAYQKGDMKKAVGLYGKAAKTQKGGMKLQIDYGFLLLKSGQIEEAETVFRKVMNNSQSRDVLNMAKSNLALVIWKKGETGQAFSMLKEIIAEYKTTSVYSSLGYIAIENGDLDEALKINLEAYDYNSENTIIQDNLAHLYHLRGETEKAGEIFTKLMDKKPHFPEAYYDYARYLEDEGRLDEADAMYQKALTCPFSFTSTVTAEQVKQDYEAMKTVKKEENPV